MSNWPGLTRAKRKAEERRRDPAWIRETEPFDCDWDDPNELTGLEGFEAAERAREEAEAAERGPL